MRRRDDFVEAFLAGYGALFFAAGARSGTLFLCGLFASSPAQSVPPLLGAFAATATARLLRRPGTETAAGLSGYHGVLVGFFLSAAPMNSAAHPLVVMLAAATAAWFAAMLSDGPWRNRWNLPSVSLPALVVSFPTLWIFQKLTGTEAPLDQLFPTYLTAHDLFRPDFYDAEFFTFPETGTGVLVRAAMFAAGFFLFSPRLLLLVLGGVAVGAAVGYAGLGWYGALNPSFVLYCATPTFVGLAGFFTTGGVRSTLFATVGVVVAFFAWFELGVRFGPAGIPLWTAPQAIATLSALAILRAFGPRPPRPLPEPVPLGRASGPEAVAQYGREVKDAEQYWQGIGDLAERPWTAFARPARLRKATELLRGARKIVVLSGAGLSTESGIPDYRTGAVAWTKYDVDHFRFERFLASEDSRRKYWEMSQDFYLILRTAEPNAGHRAVAELHRRGKLRAVVTQNVDRLHQKAGVPDELVIELHGNEHGVSCLNCGKKTTRDEVYRRIVAGAAVPHCTVCQGILKPDSTAFGQPMPEEPSRRAWEALRDADLLLIVGTSLTVQPAAELPFLAIKRGIPVLVCNLDPTDVDPFATVVLRGPAGVLLKEAVS